jgi:co-chaperonin GroES (HSP10)
MKVILNRILVKLEDIKKEHSVEGTDIRIALEYGDLEKRIAASVTQGEVIDVGPDAFSDWGYTSTKPVKPGDIVQFAKYAGASVFDEKRPSDNLAVINDEDVLMIVKSKENPNE